MAHMVAAACPMWPSPHYTAQDTMLSADLDRYGTTMPAMPPTPPSSFDQPPHHLGASQPPDHDGRRRHPRNDYIEMAPSSRYDTGMMDVMAEDAQLFEHALLAMRGDQQTYSIEESRSRNLEIRTKSRNDCAVQKSQPTKKKLSRAKLGARTSAAPPRPSLCATHPALYNKAPTTPTKHKPQTMLPTPPPEDVSKSKPVRTAPSPACRTPVLPWKIYTDPNKLISAEPQFDNPMYRRLKIDIKPDQPNVVSPLFMIGMPCGSLLEAANWYGDDEMET